MKTILDYMDAYYDWWIAFWYAHPLLFGLMLVAGLVLARYRRKK